MPSQSPEGQTQEELYQDDIIDIEGIPFHIQPPLVGATVAEFSTGLKIGPATYDEREHAFWTVLDDFSGGFSHRTLDIREAGGTHFDNVGGVDLRRRRHVTLPPKRFSQAVSGGVPSNIALYAREHAGVQSDLHDSDGFVYLGCGGAIYTVGFDGTTGQRTQATRQFEMANTNRINRILQFTGSDGTRALYACGLSTGSFNNEYHRNDDAGDVTNWDTATADGTSGVKYISDMIVWNRQIIAQTNGKRIISSADGLNWTIDATPAEDEIYRAGGFVKFLGIAMAPWGEPAVYFVDEGRLYVLDFNVRTAYLIEDLGERNFLTTGVSWNGAIFVTDGANVWEYSPATSSTVRRIGLFGKEGAPDSWADDHWDIMQFLPGTEHLMAMCRSLITSEGRLLVYNGAGWSWFGPSFSQVPYTSYVDRLPINLSLDNANRFIDSIATDGPASSVNTTTYAWKLPTTGDIPFVRKASTGDNRETRTVFENGPLSWEIGWYDGGFSDLEGALFRLQLDAFSMTETETLLVEYRLDNKDDDAYTTLGTFDSNQGRIWFNEDHKGAPFTTVQFRFTLNRETASNENPTVAQYTDAISKVMAKSPEPRSIVLVFDKKPDLRMAWTLRIDVNRMVEKAVPIEGRPATYESIWQKLRELWNTRRLLTMTIPSLESGGVNVRIADMPLTIGNFRDQVQGRGFIDLQLLEIVT